MPGLDITTGTRLHYESAGEGSPVLMIQGVGVIGEGWRPQMEALGDRHRMIAFDNRGIGQSAPLEGDITVEELARDTLALADALELETFHLVGHSLGGVIAQQVALYAPERVRSLALMCTFFRGRDGAKLTARVIWMGIRMHVGTKRMRRAAFLQNVLPARLLAEHDTDELAAELAPYFGRDLADQPPVVVKQVKALGSHDVSAELGALSKIPTLVLSATEDKIAPPRQGQLLARAIDGAFYVELENAAHGCTIMERDKINAILAGHLRAVEAGAEREG